MQWGGHNTQVKDKYKVPRQEQTTDTKDTNTDTNGHSMSSRGGLEKEKKSKQSKMLDGLELVCLCVSLTV